MKNRRVMGEKSGYWNIKGCGDAYAVFLRQLLILQRERLWRLLLEMWHKCATSEINENGGNI